MDGIQISMFDTHSIIGEEDWFSVSFREQVHRGSGFEGGKLRIYAAASLMDRDKLADFIQEEHGIGGNTVKDGFCDYNRRGMTIKKWKANEERHYPWWQVRDEVLRQIHAAQYLTDEEALQWHEIIEKSGGAITWPKPRMHYE